MVPISTSHATSAFCCCSCCCRFCRHSAPYLPLNPDIVNPTSVDIYPGLAGELLVPPQVWNSYGLEIPDDATLQFIYDTGRRDAAHWVSLQQILPTADIIHALHATSVAS